MPARRLAPLAALALLSACAPSIHVEVLRPADVALPAEIETLAVLDRSGPRNTGQAVLGTLEGLATGEGIMEDREAATHATEAVVQVLSSSPRFDVVVPSVSRKDAESNLWDRTLSWKAARRITRKSGADALVALEAFDSDSSTSVGTRVEESTSSSGNKVREIVHVAERETRVVSAWRVYWPTQELLLDDLRDYQSVRTWEEEGSTRDEALGRLPSRRDSVYEMGWVAGDSYARRIAPSYVWVRRVYYGGGSPAMKEAKRHVKAGDWQGATEIWLQVVETDDRKLRGKAEMNLALAHEVGGDLEVALEWARQAAVDLANGKSRRYVTTLELRLMDQRRLEEQLAPAAPEPGQPGAADGPAAVPAQPSQDGVMTRPDEEDTGDTGDTGGSMKRPR